MIEFVSLEEALEFAVSKERAAVRFYNDMAKKMEDESAIRVFQELAMEEMEHQAKLELELMKLGRVVRDKGSGQGPHVTRMQSLDDIPADLTREEILLLALKKEAAAFRLYVEMLALAKDDHVYELLFALSEEEMRHKLRFERMYDALKARES